MTDDHMTSQGPGTMSLTRFRALVAAYGGESDRWPQEDRDAARALAARSKEARAIRESAARLDRILAGLSPPPPSAALREDLRALGPRPKEEAVRFPWRHRAKRAGFWHLWRPAAVGGAAAAVVAAMVVLAIGPAPEDAPSESVPVSIAMDEPAPAPLEGLAVVDAYGGGGFAAFSEPDPGGDSVVDAGGGGIATSPGLDLAGLALE